MAKGFVHPSMAKVTALTEDFLKKAHKLMREKGFKLDSGTQSAEAYWTYQQENTPSVYMTGWHGRGTYGAGKTVFEINIEGSNSDFMNPDFRLMDLDDVELTPGRHHMMQEHNIKKYERRLQEALKFLNDIEAHLVTMALAK